MLKLKELEDLLNEGYFDFQGYIEMHGGPHDFVLYDEKSRDYAERRVKGWIKRGSNNYVFIPHCFDNNEDNINATVEFLEIRRRGKKVTNPLKVQMRTGQIFHWTYKNLFSGTLESLEDLKRLLKQLEIE